MEVRLVSFLCFVCLLCSVQAFAETGRDMWLRYAALDDAAARQYRAIIPQNVVALGEAALQKSAQQELVRGIRGMLGQTLRIDSQLPSQPAIVLGTLEEIRKRFDITATINADGYWLKSTTLNGTRYTIIAGSNDAGVLYGSFAFLRKIAAGETLAELDEKQSPAVAVRWVNQWDNINGTIERGYGGPSIFWENGHVREDLSRVREYGRLLASLGINGCAINNVNADTKFLSVELIPQVARIADALRPWGIKVALAVDFGSPQKSGLLNSFDPLDPAVIAWWKAKADEVYRVVPDFGGFVLKADSEGRVGPSTYDRTHADAANVVARALKPHGGVIFYRGFVYDHHMDWRNPKNDRARAAYDNFHGT